MEEDDRIERWELEEQIERAGQITIDRLNLLADMSPKMGILVLTRLGHRQSILL
jgi:hypothetical protein